MKAKQLKEILSQLNDDDDVVVTLWDNFGMKAINFQNFNANKVRDIETDQGTHKAVGHADYSLVGCPMQIYPEDILSLVPSGSHVMAKGEKSRDKEGRLISMGCKVCGKQLSFEGLYGHDTGCSCGAEYNSSGQQLRDDNNVHF